MPRKDCAKAQRVADAAEGFRHRRRQGVDLLGVIAELPGAGRANRDLPLLAGRAGDLGEALLDGDTDGVGFFKQGTALVEFCSPRRSLYE